MASIYMVQADFDEGVVYRAAFSSHENAERYIEAMTHGKAEEDLAPWERMEVVEMPIDANVDALTAGLLPFDVRIELSGNFIGVDHAEMPRHDCDVRVIKGSTPLFVFTIMGSDENDAGRAANLIFDDLRKRALLGFAVADFRRFAYNGGKLIELRMP